MKRVYSKVWMAEPEAGILLKVQEFGDSGHPLILLVSGAGAPAAFWPINFCRSIASKGYRVLRFDHRDTGASTHLNRPYGIEVLLSDVFHLVAETDPDDACIVGHSLGAYLTTMALISENSKAIKSGVAISAGPTVDPGRYAEFNMSSVTANTWERLMRNAPRGDYDRDLDGWLASWRFLNGKCAFDAELAKAYTRELYRGDPRNAQIAHNHIHAISTLPNDLPEQLAEMASPLMVIHGTEDPLVPYDNGLALARVSRNATFHTLEGAGHMFFDPAVWAELECLILRQITQSIDDAKI
jgi:pimeloyl-ACP methyl ester carboxylesterase